MATRVSVLFFAAPLAVAACRHDSASAGLVGAPPPVRSAESTDGGAAPSSGVAGLRPVAPQSVSRVTSRRPTFRWTGAKSSEPAEVSLCRARDCATVDRVLRVQGDRVRPDADLAAGVWFWRVAQGGEISPTWRFTVPKRESAVDSSRIGGTDVNGDGFDDIILVGGVALGGRRPGELTAFGAPCERGADAAVYGCAGYGMATAIGDVDGDGTSDVLEFEDVPTVEFGGDDPRMSRRQPFPSIGERPQVEALGDVNGDGYGDFLSTNDKQVTLVLGGPSLRTLPMPGVVEASAIGDWNGDGLADALADGGRILLGAPTGLVSGPSLDLPAKRECLRFAAGDLNGDGYSDVVTSQPDEKKNGIAVSFFWGGPGSRVSRATLPGEAQDCDTKATLAIVGDTDGDGRDDALVPAARKSPRPAELHLFLGDAAGLRPSRRAPLVAAVAQPLGSVVPAGDVDADGFADVLVYLVDENTGGSFVTLYLGAPGGPKPPPAPARWAEDPMRPRTEIWTPEPASSE